MEETYIVVVDAKVVYYGNNFLKARNLAYQAKDHIITLRNDGLSPRVQRFVGEQLIVCNRR